MKSIDCRKNFFSVLKLSALGLLAGAFCGLFSAAFFHLLSFSTHLREKAVWLLLLLPIGGVVIVWIYRFFGMKDGYKTNTLIENIKNKTEIPAIVAPLVFVCTIITHLFGGSAGKEGAAIQLGGAAASGISKFLRLDNHERSAFITCGMGAMFAGMFGTPITAAFFVLEFKADKKTASLALAPCFISAFTAKTVASFLGVTENIIKLKNDVSFSPLFFVKILALTIGIYLLGAVMCFILSKTKAWAKRLLPNPFIRILFGSLLLIALTVCVGDMRYSGSGMDMALAAVGGNADWYDFILKIIFTAITVSAGFIGGEIVPTFCIGATFGCILGSVLGLDVSLAAVLGLTGLFCCATNSLFSAVFLGVELFGFSILPYLTLLCVLLWLLPSKYSLFQNRFFVSPFKLRKINADLSSLV